MSTLHPTDIKLEGGKYTVVNLIVGRDEITLGNVSIADWGEGENINGGEARNRLKDLYNI